MMLTIVYKLTFEKPRNMQNNEDIKNLISQFNLLILFSL